MGHEVWKQTVVDGERWQVFDVFTTPDGLTSFFAPGARVDLQVGGVLELAFDSKGEKFVGDGEILDFSLHREVVFVMRTPAGADTRVRVSFAPLVGEKVVVEVLHDQLPADLTPAVSEAWDGVLWRLQRRMSLLASSMDAYEPFWK